MSEAKEYEGFSRYEKRWFAIGAVMLIALLAIMWYFTMANRQIIPGHTVSMEPAKLLAQPVFQHPGVSKLGPNHYRVAMIAQDFSFTPSRITVPAGAKISFVLTSRDVVHGFQVPGDMINVEVIPGRMARVSHTFEHPGTYVFDCNQYCGVGHPYMRGSSTSRNRNRLPRLRRPLPRAVQEESCSMHIAPPATRRVVRA